MKHRFIYVSFFLIWVSAINAQTDQTEAIKSFQIVVDKFSEFFKTPQKLIYKQSFSKSPTGVNAEVLEYHCNNISFDINKTESLISPFLGYVSLELYYSSNCACGNVSYTIGNYNRVTGWDNEKDALDNAYNKDCYRGQLDIAGNLDKISKDEVRVYYAFQNNKWIFKNVINTKEKKPSIVFNQILFPKLELQDSSSIKFNIPWINLIKSE